MQGVSFGGESVLFIGEPYKAPDPTGSGARFTRYTRLLSFAQGAIQQQEVELQPLLQPLLQPPLQPFPQPHPQPPPQLQPQPQPYPPLP